MTSVVKSYQTGSRLFAVFCLIAFSVVGAAQGARSAGTTSRPALHTKPYRILLVVDQWSDPYSLVISGKTDQFQPAAALLKSWSIPFDIVRLDQQHLDGSFLFDRSGGIRYGAVIWFADPTTSNDQNLAPLEEAAHAGTGLIVIESQLRDPTLGNLLGLQFKEFYASADPLHVSQQHYITRGVGVGTSALPSQNESYSNRIWVQPDSARVLIAQGEHPILTVNQVGPESTAIWFGSETISTVSNSDFWRNLFFRSLVFSLGYVVVPDVDYAHRIVFELDDWGTADKGFLNYWRYLEPSEETLRQYFLKPLQQHHATATAEVDTGYIDRQSKRVISPWTQQFTDLYGLRQDYASTRRGLVAALGAGVLEIESHGWTHMNTNLDSPPGPWWTADLKGEGSVDGWYEEFGDRRRGKEVSGLTQLYHMKRSLEELQQDFGVQALELKPGGDEWSKSQFNNTAGLATRVGFGLFHGDRETYYLDRDLALDMSSVVPGIGTAYDRPKILSPEQWPNHPDGPVILGFHDRDIALDHSFMERLFTALPTDYQTLGTNQYIAILHTGIKTTTDTQSFRVTFDLDGHYCAYFASHPSSWKLWLSDSLREQLETSRPIVSIDGNSAQFEAAEPTREALAIHLPPGLEIHIWKLEWETGTKEP